MKKRSLLIRISAGLVLTSALAVGVIGFAHTKSGRWMLRYIPGMGACPVGMDVALTPEQRDQARELAFDKVRGEGTSSGKPALGFTLGQTTRASVEGWAADRGVSCNSVRSNELRCQKVAGAAIDSSTDADEVLFVFDSAQALVTVGVTRNSMAPEAAVEFVQARASSLMAVAGPPSKERGEKSSSYLSKNKLSQVASEFSFSDYRAVVSATNMGEGRIVVREQFQLM
jgi:hypothetical protein